MTKKPSRLVTWATAVVASAAVLTLSACGSSSTNASASNTSASAASGSSQSDVVDRAKSEVAKHLDALSDFKAPGPAVQGLDKFKGGTITYSAITLQVAYFQTEYDLISEAVAPLGIKVQLCDAKATPVGAAQCINQAIAGKSVGIITDSLSFAFALNAYQAAADAGIPIVAADAGNDIPASLVGKVVTTETDEYEGARLSADEVIADSGGTAHVLFANTDNTDSTKGVSDAVLDEFKTHCPDCTVATVKWETTAVQKIPTAVSVGLNQDPKINYVLCQFSLPAGPGCVQGIKLANRSDSVKYSEAYGIDDIGQVADGNQLSAASSDPAMIAYNHVDRLLRMMTGATVPDASAYVIPSRIFTSANVNSINHSDLTGYKSGAWFSNGAFRPAYEQLWGAG